MEDAEGLYKIRVEVGNNIFPYLLLLDEGSLVILFNGFQKKTQKTPKQQIERAKKIDEKNISTKEKMDKAKKKKPS